MATSTKHTTEWHSPRSGDSRRTLSPRPQIANLLAGLAGVGFGAVTALALETEGHSALYSPGGWALAVTRFSGFWGGYLLLLMVLLMVRLPWLERTVGQDQLVRWHRKVAPWATSLTSLHVLAAILGYAQMLHNSILSQAWIFVLHYPDMLAAYVGWILLLVAAFSSIRIARRKMRYETWWVVHLYTYLGLGLAFMHQIRTGIMFLGHPLSTQMWTWTWIGAGVVTLLWRVAVPVVRNLRFGLRVADISEVAPGVRSVTVSGRHLDRLAVNGGQFFQWRFMAKELWWHSHPYSLSALPRPPFLRVTVKGLGDQSSALKDLKVGTRVFVEGPYGAFTRHRMTRERVVLIGAGVGITPLRALLEDLPENRPVSVIIRARTAEDVVHGDEMKLLVGARKGSYHELIGSRYDVSLDAATLTSLAHGLADSDVFICGPEGFTESVVASLQEAGVPHSRIHFESFTF